MLSLVAMTAVPMGAYADADLTKNITEAVNALEQGDGLTVTDGVIASPGAKVELSIGTFVPGKYQLTAKTQNNVKLSLKGIVLAGDGTFTLTAETTVTVVAESTDGKEFAVGGFGLTHVYDYMAMATALRGSLAEITAKLNSCDPTEASVIAYKEEASAIAAQIKVLEGTDAETLYKAYKDYKLYEEESVIGAEINALASKVNAKVGDTTAKNNAVAAMESLTVRLDEVKVKLDKATEYTTKKHTSTYESISSEIKAELAAIEAAYNAGTAGTTYTEEYIKEKTTSITAKITKLEADIAASEADETAYIEVSKAITAAKTLYNETIVSLRSTLPGDPDVYEDLYKEAQVKLAEALTKLTTAEKANGTKDSHDNAAETRTANETLVTEATTTINDTKSEYETLAQNLKSAYSSATQDITGEEKGVQTALDKLKEELTAADVLSKYQKDVDNAQKLITALSDKIEAANKAHTIIEVVNSQEYVNERSAASKAITDVETKAAKDLANYRAWKTMTDEVASLRTTYTETKTSIDALVSEDGSYTVSGKYTGKTITDAISKYEKAAENAYKKGTAVDEQSKQSGTKTTIEAEITTWYTNAQNAVAHYNEFAAALETAKTALEELKTTATNRDVTAEEGVTYAAKIAEIEEFIKTQETAIATAMSLTDDKHFEAVTALSKEEVATITVTITTLTSSYAENEKNYNATNLQTAARLLSEQAWTTIEAAQNTLSSIQTSIESLTTYPTYQQLYSELTRLQGEVGKIADDCPEYSETSTNYTELMASLNKVIEELSKLNANIADLETAVDEAYKVVKANEDNKKAADALFTEIRKIMAKAKGEYSSDLFDDDDKVTPSDNAADEKAFVQWYAKLEASLITTETEITASYEKWELNVDWTETFKSVLDGYKKEAEELRTKATNEMENYKAYTSVVSYYNKQNYSSVKTTVVNALKKATNDGNGDGYNYYRDLLDGENNKSSYEKQWEKIMVDITASYEGYTAAADQEGQKKEIDRVIKEIKDLSTSVADNEEAYNEQITKSQEVLDYWSTVYSEISANDESSQKQSYLDQLIDIQNELLELNKQVKEDWGAGNSHVNGAMEKYAVIYQKITNISGMQQDGYDQVVLDDNSNRYTAFLNEATATQNIYITAITVIGQLTGTANPEYAEKITNIIDANKDIYKYSGLIRELKDKAEESFNTAQNTAGMLWDEKQKNKADAATYGKEITDKLNTLIDQIYNAAKETLSSQLTYAKTQYNIAVSELMTRSYSETVLKGAFSDVKLLIDAVGMAYDEQTEKDVNKQQYALSADGWLTQLADIDDMIAAGKQDAAKAEWNALITEKNAQITKEQTELEGFVSDGNLDNSTLAYYNGLVEYYVREAERQAASSTDLYEGLTDIKDLIAEFDRLNPYADLKKAVETNEANNTAYGKLTAQIGDVQTLLDELEVYAQNYYIYYNCVSTINNLQTRINSVMQEVEGAYNANTAATLDITEALKSIETAISTARTMMDINEANALKAEILKLRNTNALVNKGDDKKTAFEAMEVRIDVLEDGVSAAQNKKEGKQEAFVAMEKEIAKLQTELKTLENANAVKESLDNLNNALGTVAAAYQSTSTLLESSHTKVQETYTAVLQEIGVTIATIQRTIETVSEEQSAIFYENKITTSITNVGKEIDALIAKINEMDAPYKTNDEVYVSLTGEIEALRTELVRVTGVIDGYSEVVKNSECVTNYVVYIEQLLSEATTQLQAEHEAVKLTESSTVYNASYIISQTSCLEKRAAGWQASLDISGLRTSLSGVKDIMDDNDYSYSAEILSQMYGLYSTIYKDIEDVYTYYSENYNNDKFVSENIPVINVRIGEIKADIDELRGLAENNRFMLGDVTGDGAVMVDDYTAVRNVVLKTQTLEEGSLEFLAADVNGDGKINIGDVTGVARIVMKPLDNTVRAAARRMPVACDDAISLSSEGEGTQQRIAINLSAARTYVGCQMDIKLPAGITLAGESLGNRAAGLTLSSNDIEGGIHRIVVSSLSEDSFADGDGAIIWLDVEVAYSYSGEGIEVTNIMFADAAARVYTFADLAAGETTGIRTLTVGEAVKGKIYSVGGKLMDGLKRGVNIIRGNDGTTKKVIVK